MIKNSITYMWMCKDGTKGACSPCLQIFNVFNEAVQYGIKNHYERESYYLIRILTTSVYDSHGDILVETITKDRMKY